MIEDTITQAELNLLKEKEEAKQKRKLEKKALKSREKKLKLDYEALTEENMQEGDLVADDDLKGDVTTFQEYRDQLSRPIEAIDGLLTVDGKGDLFYKGIKQDTDSNHTVNRHVVKQMLKDLYEKVDTGGEEERYVSLHGRQTIDADAMTQNQNRHKNKYVRNLRNVIMNGQDWGEEEEYRVFKHKGKEYFLKRKTKNPVKPKGVHYRAKEEIEKHLDQSKGMDQRIIELEAENSVLRQKRKEMDVHYPTDANRVNAIPDLPELKSQVMDVNPALDYAKPGPVEPNYMPLYKSPSLRYINQLFQNDYLNYSDDKEKELFGPIFNPTHKVYPGLRH